MTQVRHVRLLHALLFQQLLYYTARTTSTKHTFYCRYKMCLHTWRTYLMWSGYSRTMTERPHFKPGLYLTLLLAVGLPSLLVNRALITVDIANSRNNSVFFGSHGISLNALSSSIPRFSFSLFHVVAVRFSSVSFVFLSKEVTNINKPDGGALLN